MFGELCVGFEQGNRRERNLAELEEFLAAPVVEFLPAGKQEANIFGSIVTLLKKQGTPIPTNDIWIAAICASAGATLITYDDHFRSVSRIGALVIGLR